MPSLHTASFALARALQLHSSVVRRSLPPRNLGGSWRSKMANRGQEDHDAAKSRSGARVDKVQELVGSDPTSGWEKCWEEGVTPWDLGKPTPIIEHLHQTGSLPKGRALVPGCGTGYDVTAIACPERYVIGLDISGVAIKKAVEVSSSLPNANYFTFLEEDFFTWQPSELFDLIFDYTFFCAIYPEMRPAWAQRITELLKPDGELITLMFPISEHAGGPPYKVSVSELDRVGSVVDNRYPFCSYEEVLSPMGFKATSIMDNDLAVGPRQGREKLGRWKRLSAQSAL